MSVQVEEIKKAILEKYDQEAIEKNNSDWLLKGGNERVPESKASHYFIDRKVNQALLLCGNEIARAVKFIPGYSPFLSAFAGTIMIKAANK